MKSSNKLTLNTDANIHYSKNNSPTSATAILDYEKEASKIDSALILSSAQSKQSLSACSSFSTVSLLSDQEYENLQLILAKENSLADSEYFDVHSSLLFERMQEYNMTEKYKVSGDGNCQFSAIKLELIRINHPYKDFTVSELRKLAVDEITSNQEFYGNFLQDETLDFYIKSMLHSEQGNVRWGDELTIKALVEALGISILVISSGFPEPLFYQPKTECWSDDILYLCHWADLHYGVMEPCT